MHASLTDSHPRSSVFGSPRATAISSPKPPPFPFRETLAFGDDRAHAVVDTPKV